MISCRDAKNLFGRYLDGELNPSMQTELNAHRIHCTGCQNELALMEACGDVVALDRREPTVSASFTDRVLLARRAQVRPQRRNWARTLLVFGSPMAAAASIALMFAVIHPAPRLRTAVLTKQETLPSGIRESIATRSLSPEENAQMNSMPVTPAASFVENLLAPAVEKSKNTADNVRRSASDLLMLLHEGISSTNQTLMAQWRSTHPEGATEPAGSPPLGDLVGPGSGSEFRSPTGDPIGESY